MVLDPKPSNSGEGSQKRLDREIKEMVSTLTNRITELHPKNKTGSEDDVRTNDDDDHGIRVITLAGNNTGATMRADLGEMLDGQGFDHEMLGAYANSNYQAINNSIMMHGSYAAEDPGVHMFISDHVDEEGHLMEEHGKKKEKKKGSPKSKKEHPSDMHSEKTSEVEPN